MRKKGGSVWEKTSPRRHKKILPKGFTIIETVFYIAIFSTVIIGLVAFSFEIVKNRVKNQVLFSVERDVRFCMLRMTQEINDAMDVNEDSSVFGVHPGILSLEMPEEWKDPVVFDVTGGSLRVSYGNEPPVLLTSESIKVTNLVFSNYSVPGHPKTLKIDMSAEYINPENSEEYFASTTVTTSVTLKR